MNQTESKPALIRIVDDDAGLRNSLRYLLENEGYAVAEYPDARSFLVSDKPSEIGCAVLDVRMPGMSGIELQREMKERGIGIPIVFLTAFAEVDMAVECIRNGAFHFLQKPVGEEKLLEAIGRAVEKDRLSREALPGSDQMEARAAELTERERSVLSLAVSGLTNIQIAERLGIALRTVKFHRASAYRKLGIRGASGLRVLKGFDFG